MLFPRKVKHRKWQTMRRNPRRPKTESRGLAIAFGAYGLKALTPGRLKSTQLEAGRKAVTHELQKAGKLWIRVFPDRPYTKKPAEVGMGKGKGDPQGYEFVVWPGRIVFELDGVTEADARKALRKAGSKFTFKTKVVSRS